MEDLNEMSSWVFQLLKMMTPCCLEISGFNDSVTWHHIPGEQNLQFHHCKSLKICKANACYRFCQVCYQAVTNRNMTLQQLTVV